jgi:hypothetical protein
MASLSYYAEPGPLTTAALAGLPSDVPELLDAVQGLLVHEAGSAESASGHLRAAHEIVECLLAVDPRPLTQARAPAQRLAGSCRHFTLLMVAALRAHGVPARARCGFARYFTPGRYGDHWVCEYWDTESARWLLADADVDPSGITFDPARVPRDQFVVAGEVWIRCRAGRLDPSRCGLEGDGQSGWWWIAGNLVRDVAAMSKMELLPWDMWGAMPRPGEPITDSLAEDLDRLAAGADPSERFRVPSHVFNFVRQRHEPVVGHEP